MKKLLTFVLAIITLTLSSCDKDDDVIKTTVQVSVLKNGSPLKDTKVYLFESSSKEPKIINAKASAVTSNNGTVTFVLEDVKGITLTDAPQTFTFYIFSPTFEKNVSIKKGEAKSVTISYNSLV